MQNETVYIEYPQINGWQDDGLNLIFSALNNLKSNQQVEISLKNLKYM